MCVCVCVFVFVFVCVCVCLYACACACACARTVESFDLQTATILQVSSHRSYFFVRVGLRGVGFLFGWGVAGKSARVLG